MHPTPVKHEYEIADALERWSEQERTLRAHGDEYKLNVFFKITCVINTPYGVIPYNFNHIHESFEGLGNTFNALFQLALIRCIC